MKNLYLLISIIGLILDLLGFIGIYVSKLKNVSTIDGRNFFYLNHMMNGNNDLKTISEGIIEQVNSRLKSINDGYLKQDRRTLKFFLLVIFGVSLQILSVIVYACQIQC